MKDIDENLIEGKDEITLAKWYCMLNSWKWPEELGEEEPRPTGMPRANESPRRNGYMNLITSAIGHEKCSRQWNIDRMTDEEHAEFYKRSFHSARTKK